MRREWRDARAVTAVEFALAAPVLLFCVLGGFELGYVAYVRSVLEGEMQAASRDRTLESASGNEQRALIEKRVRDGVHVLAPDAEVTFERTAFRDYSAATKSYEPYNDANGNGTCDAGEVYEDVNNNAFWDMAAGKAGSDGGARDVVVYTATVRYDQLPLAGFLEWQGKRQISATTALRNQPYDQQGQAVERSCA